MHAYIRRKINHARIWGSLDGMKNENELEITAMNRRKPPVKYIRSVGGEAIISSSKIIEKRR